MFRARLPSIFITSHKMPRLPQICALSRRLPTMAGGWATSNEHTLNPLTPGVKLEPLLRIREKGLGNVI